MGLTGENNMILTTQQLMDQYSNYGNPKNKISREVKERKLFPIVKGLYETDEFVGGPRLAQFILGPSYISFDYALYRYSIIPEAVYNTITCATFDKRKRKRFDTMFGTFLYRDVPKDVFKYGVNFVTDGTYTFQIATQEKAICDKLYTISPARSLKEFKRLLFEDLRVNKETLNKMNKEFIFKIAPMYKTKNLNYLVKYFEEIQ